MRSPSMRSMNPRVPTRTFSVWTVEHEENEIVSQRVQIFRSRDAATPSARLARGRGLPDAASASRSVAAAIAAAAVAGGILLTPGPAAASVLSYGSITGLEADADVGACGGSIGCVDSQEQLITPATSAQTASAVDGNTADGGQNTSNAFAISNFASQHVYAEAYASYTGSYYGSYAETKAVSDTYDVFDVPNNGGGPVAVNFKITGSETPTQGIYGASDTMYFQFLVYDITHGNVIENYTLIDSYTFSGPAAFTISYNAPPGDKLSIESDFEADAYVSSYDYDALGNHLNVVADFSHTLTYTLVGAAGLGDIVGESGHDYSLPLSSGSTVPEPSTWVLIFLGFAAAGLVRLRRAKTAKRSPPPPLVAPANSYQAPQQT